MDKSKAEKTLFECFRNRCDKNDSLTDEIESILSGNHKTYKYILLTGLLAKATDNKVNPLVLQAGADIKGAYDARSLCHQVLVPFERDFLNNALGGSNEPFLNKPARFTHLSKNNAVRKGQDKETLIKLIEILSKINSSGKAKSYLACALKFLSKRIKMISKLTSVKIDYNPELVEIYEFILRLLDKSFEGVTPVLAVATLESLFYHSFDENFNVEAHNVYQSGSSSKEIGDIDIYKNSIFEYAIEVKDKSFTPYDLEHAVNKVVNQGGKKASFIFGPNAKFNRDEIFSKLKEFEKMGIYVLFDSVFNYARTLLFKISSIDKNNVITELFSIAKNMNCKEEVFHHCHLILNNLSWSEKISTTLTPPDIEIEN